MSNDSQTMREGIKPKLLEVLRKHHGAVKLEVQRPKQRSKYSVSFDQGAYKGSNVTTFNYQSLDPLLVCCILADEYPNFRFDINELLLMHLTGEGL
ncbi:MAG: hypothetical protein KGL39_50450 [Patescibacteria group bacterium]|nr:hypothetical protein [Patescibacteria group bacterium]